MQVDRRLMIRLGSAIVVAVVVGLWRLISGALEAPRDAAPAQSAPPVVAEQTSAQSPSSSRAPSETSAEAPVAQGDFAYYVLVLSWSPTHCSSQAGHDDDMQCRSGRPYGFVLHGLWPQNERGYPQSCDTSQREVSSENMERMLKVSPSEDLVRHEWQKHGTCSGLSQNDFVSSAISAYTAVTVPSDYNQPDDQIQTSPDDVREAFLSANPSLKSDDVAATCSRNDLAEVWVCLDKSLKPRACSNEVLKRHCGARHVRMRAVRGDWP